MKAAVFYGEKDVRIEELPDPSPGPGEVLLRPKYCGICGSDLDAWNRGMYTEGVVIGHEFSAEVLECGPGVSQWNPGDTVVVNSIIPCKNCQFCSEGEYSLCDNMQMPGISMNGGLAELTVMPSDSLIPIPESVSLKEAALTEPLAVVLHGFRKITVRPGDKVLILGAGTIGLFALQAALLSGASFAAVSEPNSARRTLAGNLGAHHLMNPVKSNVSIEFEEKSGQAPDLVVECAGSPAAASETFSLARKGGTILVLGISEEPVDADFFTGVLNELTYKFSYCGYTEFPTALELIAKGMVDARRLLSGEIALEEIVEKGFQELANPDSDKVKILVKI